jgi:hypothetical protein
MPIGPSDGLWRLSRLQFVNDRMLVTPVDYAFVGQDLGTCHMRSSATVWTEPGGEMRFYCHQRMVRQGIFEGSESVPFTGFSDRRLRRRHRRHQAAPAAACARMVRAKSMRPPVGSAPASMTSSPRAATGKRRARRSPWPRRTRTDLCRSLASFRIHLLRRDILRSLP